jgi:hypothetical protein
VSGSPRVVAVVAGGRHTRAVLDALHAAGHVTRMTVPGPDLAARIFEEGADAVVVLGSAADAVVASRVQALRARDRLIPIVAVVGSGGPLVARAAVVTTADVVLAPEVARDRLAPALRQAWEEELTA